jgi:dihydropteroate synthase
MRPVATPSAFLHLVALKNMQWRCRHRIIDLTRPVVMGILNVTRIPFSDGNRYAGIDAALERAAQIVRDGAAIIDVGGESTRPGAGAVDEALKLRGCAGHRRDRRRLGHRDSIDTSKPR